MVDRPCIDGKICNGNFITWPYWNDYCVSIIFYRKSAPYLVHDVHVYNYGGTLIYTDANGSRNTVENNLLIGAADHGNYLYHHCGLDNISKNNIIHR